MQSIKLRQDTFKKGDPRGIANLDLAHPAALGRRAQQEEEHGDATWEASAVSTSGH